MHALTLKQPWASQVFDHKDPKDVENRKTLRPPPWLCGRTVFVNGKDCSNPFFAVHAGLGYDPAPGIFASSPQTSRWVNVFPPGASVPPRAGLPRGAVIGVARVRYALDVRGTERLPMGGREMTLQEVLSLPNRRWWLGPIGWRLFDAIPLPLPVPCRGALGLWKLPANVAERVRCDVLETLRSEQRERARPHPPESRIPWIHDVSDSFIDAVSRLLDTPPSVEETVSRLLDIDAPARR